MVKDTKYGQAKISFERKQALPTIPAIAQISVIGSRRFAIFSALPPAPHLKAAL